MAAGRSRFWRLLGFTTVYGLAAVAVTVLFWRSPQPSADQVVTTTTTAPSPSPTSTNTSSNASTAGTGLDTTLDPALATNVTLTANSAYGISGTAQFTNTATVVLHNFSLTGHGLTIHVELRDTSGNTVATIKDLTKQDFDAEDVVIAVPTTIDLTKVASIAIVATDYQLVLSQAVWRSQ